MRSNTIVRSQLIQPMVWFVLALSLCFGGSVDVNAASSATTAFNDAKKKVRIAVRRNRKDIPDIVANTDGDKIPMYVSKDQDKIRSFCAEGCSETVCRKKKDAALTCVALCSKSLIPGCHAKAYEKFPNALKKLDDSPKLMKELNRIFEL